MTTRTKIIGIAYSAWAIGFFLIAVYGALFSDHGEYGVSAHLWLTLTGMPFSLLSWGVPHGSVIGVGVAAVAGIIQWGAISELWAWWERRISEGRNET